MNDNQLEVQLTHLDGCAVLAFRGDIDMAVGARFQESIEQAMELGVHVVLDMEQVTFMDSTGIRALLVAAGATPERSRRVQIMRPTDQVRQVLTLTRLDRVFAITP